MSDNDHLSRRTFLRGCVGGVSVALGLPMLEAMLPTGPRKLQAAQSDQKPFFGVFYWANGVPWSDKHGATQAGNSNGDLWTPSENGTYTPTPMLQPLARHNVNVASGLEPHTDVPQQPPGQGDGHMRGFMVALTGDRPRSEGFNHGKHLLTALRPSIDQYVANHPDFYDSNNPPRFKSLEVGVSKARFHDYGHWDAISYNGPESRNPPVLRPTVLFDRLFNVETNAEASERRAKMLDAVLEDAKDLKKQLGADDRKRVDAHMQHISEIQKRLSQEAASCKKPLRPKDGGSLIKRTETMAKLLATAINCGLTRVFSFMLTSPASTHVFDNLGVGNGLHYTCHDGQWNNVKKVTEHQMKAFAKFLDAFDIPTPGGGKLIDRGVIFGTSEYGEGFKHSTKEMPVVLTGGGCGRLKSGFHTREKGGNISKAHLTALKALGLSDSSYGWHGGKTSDVVSGFLA